TRTTGARECARFDKPLLLSCSAAECRPGAGKPQGFSLSVISGLAALAEWIPMKKTVALGLLAISAVVQANGVVPATDPLLRGSIYVDLARAGDRVVAVGDRGHIIYSDDEGQHWRQAETPTSVLLTAVCFADAEHGWAVGHDAVVLGTRDGGATWVLQYSDALDDGAEALDDEALSDEELYNDDIYSDDLYSDDP